MQGVETLWNYLGAGCFYLIVIVYLTTFVYFDMEYIHEYATIYTIVGMIKYIVAFQTANQF